MNSRERIALSLEHKTSDRVPIDFGGSVITGMHASVVYSLRQALGLDPLGTPVKVIDPFQMLGEIAPDLAARLHSDVVPLMGRWNCFGFENSGWKPWTLFDGTPVLVPDAFTTTPDPTGNILLYPQGDTESKPSGFMPAGGYWFDAIERAGCRDVSDQLDPSDNVEEYVSIADDDVRHFAAECERLHSTTDKAIVASIGGTSFGDVADVPGPALKSPRGIRTVIEWYGSLAKRPQYIYEVFERQCDIGLGNLAKVFEAVGDRVSVVVVSTTDFGMQKSLLISPKTYRDLFKPFNRAVNDWVHAHTSAKTFFHCCGSIAPLLPDLIDAGFDIFNPVQTSARGMDPAELKRCFGDELVFWGGGVNTQWTLPFGSPAEVKREVRDRIRILGSGGGFVYSAVHNITAGVPTANVLAMVEALDEYVAEAEEGR